MKFRKSPMTAAAAAVLAIYALPGAAQDAAAGAAPTPEAATQLEGVKVQYEAVSPYKAEEISSPKYTAPLRDTPKSVTVIPSQLIQDVAATSLQEALRTVPGITFMAGEGGQPIADRPVIRGLNSANSLFIDGIRDIGSQTRDVFALDGIEVTKGADSAFGGRGSGGGSVNLVSKQAKAEDFANASLLLGTADTLRATVDRNWKVNEHTAARLNVMGNHAGVAGRDSAVVSDKWGAAGALAFGLGSPTRISLDYYHLSDDGMPDYSIPYDLATGLPVTETLGVDRKNFYGLKNRDFLNTQTDIGTVSISHDLSPATTLSSSTRYGISSNDYLVSNPDDSAGNVANGLVYRSPKSRISETETFANLTTLSTRFDTGFIKHSLSTGVEFSREQRDQDTYTVNRVPAGTARVCTQALQDSKDCASLYNPNPNDLWLGQVLPTNTPTHFTTTAGALFAFDTLELHKQWLVNLGLRWDSYETEAQRNAGATPATTPVPVAALYASREDNFLNYQLGLIYKPVETGSIYLAYSTESTPQAIAAGDEDAVTAVNAVGKPEKARTAELGAKWELFGQRLLLTGALFDTERKDALLQLDTTTYQQVGKTRVRGFELSASGNLSDNWSLFGGYSYLDSKLVRGSLYIAAPSEILDPSQGKQLPNTPKHSLSLASTYKFLQKYSVGGGAYYVSEVYGSTQTTRNTSTGVVSIPKHVPDYWRFDLNAGWQVNPNIGLQFNVQNLLDEVYYTKAYSNHYAALGTGRQYLLTANFSF
ncbi:TonB-dependent siderophore receptor [Stagnimonas aquatica]|uniref:TonB-dependent siderophore receptor n=1 Tax=Stagnimonas aquatica TaxID=2689987 RepID=A0A3N0VGT9_9GAMM|nr:TonB-dependent siderophore receptor [Stagnimonas aquatica]ROH91901.1 TonB-dependent siderophore receptor [Stagnimonas aquatica]